VRRWSERIGRVRQSAHNGENKREAKQGCLPEVWTIHFSETSTFEVAAPKGPDRLVNLPMSALPPKAEVVQHERDVRFVPKAVIGLLTHVRTVECVLRKPPSITTSTPRAAPAFTLP